MTGENTKKNDDATKLKINEQKWTPTVWAAGWTALPSILLEHQHAIGLDAVDLNIVLHLAMYWWRSDNKPFPAKSTIARAMKVDPRTVQRRIARLEKAGLIHREQQRIPGKGSKPNRYHLGGLIAELQPFAEAKLQERAEQQAKKEARMKRKGRPPLTVIK